MPFAESYVVVRPFPHLSKLSVLLSKQFLIGVLLCLQQPQIYILVTSLDWPWYQFIGFQKKYCWNYTIYQFVVSFQILCLYDSIVNAACFSILYNMSCQYYLVNNLLMYCAQYCGASINPKLVISNWFGWKRKYEKNVSYGCRICVLEEIRRIVTGWRRSDSE